MSTLTSEQQGLIGHRIAQLRAAKDAMLNEADRAEWHARILRARTLTLDEEVERLTKELAQEPLALITVGEKENA
jgi:hypothetical protein